MRTGRRRRDRRRGAAVDDEGRGSAAHDHGEQLRHRHRRRGAEATGRGVLIPDRNVRRHVDRCRQGLEPVLPAVAHGVGADRNDRVVAERHPDRRGGTASSVVVDGGGTVSGARVVPQRKDARRPEHCDECNIPTSLAAYTGANAGKKRVSSCTDSNKMNRSVRRRPDGGEVVETETLLAFEGGTRFTYAPSARYRHGGLPRRYTTPTPTVRISTEKYSQMRLTASLTAPARNSSRLGRLTTPPTSTFRMKDQSGSPRSSLTICCSSSRMSR